MKNLQAVIICGGIGSRMGEFTANKPKGLLVFEGKPILSHILDRITIACGGLCEVILATGFGGDLIKEFYGTSYKGLTLRFVHDDRQLGTRNRLLLTRNLIKESFLFLAGDIIVEPRLICNLIKAHWKQPSAIATVGLAIDHKPAPGHGVATVDRGGCVSGLWFPPISHSDVTQYREMHVCVFSPEFLELLIGSNVTEISKGLMRAVEVGQEVRAVIYDGSWAHFVYPGDLVEQKLPSCKTTSIRLPLEMAAANQMDAGTLCAKAYKDESLLAKRKALYRYTEPHCETSTEVLALLDITPGLMVLDTGCGTGDVILKAAEDQSEATFIGIDISLGIIREAQKTAALKHLPAYFLSGDIQQLNFDLNTFDRVLALHMLYHVPDMNLAVQELRRVLKDNGVCIVSLNSIESKPFLRMIKVKAAAILGCDQYPDMTVRLNIENGCELLREYFDQVETKLYESVITLNNPQPYIDYVDSTREFWQPHPHDDQWQSVLRTVREEVAAVIKREGAFKEKNIFGILIASGCK